MSTTNPAAPASPNARAWKLWNQRIHLYVGLYFLVFLWLFSVSGLLLNHAWRFTEFWNQRRQETREQAIILPAASPDTARANEVMRQLNLAGELDWTATRPTAERFEFRVTRPGRTVDVKVDVAKQIAAVQEIRVNGWGILRALHTFTGTRMNAASVERDWTLTRLWSFSMDALSVGLILLVLTSIVLGFARPERRLGASVALLLGLASCGFFVFGLRWL